jgi:hypothetical protein
MNFEYSSSGAFRNATWNCEDCPSRSDDSTLHDPPDAVRDDAIRHLGEAGHRVSFARGTLELLIPLATKAAQS